MWVFVKNLVKTGWWLAFFLLVAGFAAGTILLRGVHRMDAAIVRQAEATGADPRLVAAIVSAASRFDPAHVDGVRYGLMGLTTGDAALWSEAHGKTNGLTAFDLFDADLNLRIGSWTLVRRLDAWAARPDSRLWALAEFRADHATVERWAAVARPADPSAAIADPAARTFVRAVLVRSRPPDFDPYRLRHPPAAP